MFSKKLLLGMALLFSVSSSLIAQVEEKEEVFSINELIGKSEPKKSYNIYKLRYEVYQSFLRMQQAALKEGIKIKIVSAFRSYDHQQRIWNRKFKRFKSFGMSDSLAVEKILEYSTIPGTSRHHWGTDIDIVMETPQKIKKTLLPTNFEGNGPYVKLKKWLDKNAEQFSFKLIYTNDPDRKGFHYEPWHYTYYPTSKKMLEAYEEKKSIKNITIERNLGNHYLDSIRLYKYLKNNVLIKNTLE